MNHSRIKASVAALAVAGLIGLSACGGGSDGLSRADEEALQMEAAAAEEARKAAEEAKRQAEEAQRQAEEAQRQAEEAKQQAEEEARQAELERVAAEARAEEARRQRQAEEQARLAAEEQRQREEEARQEAERQAEEARQEAQRRIEEAARQADVAVRAPLLITELISIAAADVGANMGVQHMPGESRTFTRPNNLPAKGSAPSVPGSWSSASYSGPRGAVGTDTVYLYTNIQGPSSKAFWKVHGESVGSITGTPTPAVAVSGFGTQARELYPAADGTLDGTGTTSGSDKGSSIGGTYDGYSGTFKCDADCDIAAADGGALTFHGTWTFTASLTAKKSSRYVEQDSEFLYFGIWAFEPTVATGTPDFKWAAGGDVTDITNFGALEGEATFTGGAIGKYALASATGRGARAAKTGTFTATATFTADFDRAADGTDGNSISGRITDFKEGGNDLGAGWNIFLGSSASAAAALTAAGAGATAGGVAGAIDGDNVTAGAWNATLHGSDNPGASSLHTADAAKYPASRYPVADVAGVAGWFNAAAGTDAAIAGAFGAACTIGTMCAK